MAEKSDVSPESGMIKDATTRHDAHEAVHTEEAAENEKGGLATLDTGYTESDVIADLPPAEGLRALRKVDYRLVPLLAILYLVAFIDRSNMQVALVDVLPSKPLTYLRCSGNARIAGLTDDLHLAGLQYNTAVTLFFPPYCLFEVPSNIVLKIIRPSLWLSILLFSWGSASTGLRPSIDIADCAA